MHQFASDFYGPKDHHSIPPHNFCEVVHIGIVCAGYASNVHFHSMLKSLFLTRSNPIHFHILVSDDSSVVLQYLFKTWQIPKITLSFYNINPWLKDVRWVPNGHYSGSFGLLKLIFNKIIPPTVTNKILVLDTDLIINEDIYLLWKHFENFKSKQMIGIAENQSPYYLGLLGKLEPWPALSNGFNSGVMLLDLEKLNAMKWDALWTNLTKKYSQVYGPTDLGDQDIINSVIKENPNIIYQLPCYWNVQMSTRSTSSTCYGTYKPKILHWNSPQKYTVSTKDGELFRGIANSIFEADGNWFRHYPQICVDGTYIVDVDISYFDECEKFSKSSSTFYRTLLYFTDFKLTPDVWEITYVTHLSFDRLEAMEMIAGKWTGPISFSLYISDAELVKVRQFIIDSQVLNGRTDIAYHAIFKQGEFYPINILRNTGLKHVKTSYVFLVDVDFMPMKSLADILKDNLKTLGNLDKKALVVPAFEPTDSNIEPPSSKAELIDMLDSKSIRPFLSTIWSEGHSATNYDRWRKEFEPYKIKWQAHYEPYILVKSDVTPYDERFMGFGWNKVSHTMELEAQKYEFIVLSDVFIIHQPHFASTDHLRFRQSPLYNKCIQLLKRQFINDLSSKYHRDFNVTIHVDRYDEMKRTKRDIETTTTFYDSTDYFLLWGGKEKVEKRRLPKKAISSTTPRQYKVKYDYYYYYEDTAPYNLTILKINGAKGRAMNKDSAERKDYEYDEDDIKFKQLHEVTTMNPQEGEVTILSDKELVPEEHKVFDEKLKPH